MKFRHLTPTDRIPVIALTRRGDVQTELAAVDHGVDDIAAAL